MAAIKDRTAVEDSILHSMVQDGLSLRKAATKAGTSAQSFLRWCSESPPLAEQYARARESLVDRLADELFELCDSPVPMLETGAVDPGIVRQRQLQIDTRKWFLSKVAPKVYGDRLDVQVTDNRISISGALQAAQTRLADVIDVTPRLTASCEITDEGGVRADDKDQAVADTP